MSDHIALWAPTLVSIVMGLVFGGGVIQRVKDHGKILEKHTDEINTNALDIAKLNAWRDGYNAATNRG